ncbi:MAG: hypothetical protein G01um101430_92 [Parcubacteria group bacterium Gr01-1014_30]|nr:MAG: hypothetical protein G01um101430_92 [Parcubacteria group bacterium Gr01-1014_30]
MRVQKKHLFLSALLLVIFASVLGVCYGSIESLCAPGRYENTAIFIMLFSASMFLSILPLIFLPDSFSSTWFRFTKYYLPITAIIIIITPGVDTSILGVDKEFMTWALSGLYLFLSLIIIFWKHLRAKKEKPL